MLEYLQNNILWLNKFPKCVLHYIHGHQYYRFNSGGMGGYIPPRFWEGGDGQCFHPPPGNEWSSGISYVNCLIYQHGKVWIQLFFDGLSLIFIIQLVGIFVNHWNKHNCFPNCSHIQVIYSICWPVTSTTHKESLLYLPDTSFIRASN